MIPYTAQLNGHRWAGARVFVVGSGPSTEGYDLATLLRDEITIGINEEYRWGPTVAMCQDLRFFLGEGGRTGAKDTPAWYGSEYPLYFHQHPDLPLPAYDDRGCILQASPAVRGGAWFWPKTLGDGLTAGPCTAIAALSLADALGAARVYLLGCDCRDAADGAPRRHNNYPQDWTVAKPSRPEVYKRWIEGFRQWAPQVRAHVVAVESALEDAGVFQGMPLSNFLLYLRAGVLP